MTSMRRHYVASTSLRRHLPAGNLAPPWPPQYSKPWPPQHSKPSYAYAFLSSALCTVRLLQLFHILRKIFLYSFYCFLSGASPPICFSFLVCFPRHSRLISVEDVRNNLSHIIYILIFDFFLNFLLYIERQMRFNVNL